MLTLDIKDKLPGSYTHVFAGDVHGFVRGYPWKKLEDFIKTVKSNKNCFFSLGGDDIDCMSPQDNRYKIGQYEGYYERADVQANKLVELLSPISDRMLWKLYGNHEGRQFMNIMDFAKYICVMLGCDVYGTMNDHAKGSQFAAKVDFGAFKVMDWHGAGVVNSKSGDEMQRYSNDCISIKRKLRDLPIDDCDVAVMHHVHKTRISPPTGPKRLRGVTIRHRLKGVYIPPTRIPTPEGGYYMHEEDRWYCSSGALQPGYVDGFSTYAEVKGYKFTEMSWVKAIVKNDKFIGLEEIIL